MKVEIWSDIVCPFCYIGNEQFNKALDKFQHKAKVEVVHHSYQLMPDAPKKPSGRKSYEDLAEIKGVDSSDMLTSFSDVAELGKKEGLDMKMFDTVLTNTFDGHQLIHFAHKHGKQKQAVSALFRTHFSDALDIADRSVLLSVVKELGLDENAFGKSLDGGEFENDVKDDIKKAVSIGLQGVPFFVIDDTFGISGASGVDSFYSALQTAWKENHPLHMLGDEAVNVCADNGCL